MSPDDQSDRPWLPNLDPQLYVQALRQSPVCVAIITQPQWLILEISHSVVRLTGYPRQEMLGRHVNELEIWPDHSQVRDIRLQLEDDGSIQNLELPYLHRSGQLRTCLISAEIIRSQEEPCLVAGMIDITDRKEEERKLRESEERFSFLAETTGDALYRLRYDTMTYDYLSKGITTLTGYTPEDFRHMSFASLVQKIELNGQEIPSDYIRQKRREGDTGEFRADYLVKTKSGELKWLGDHSFPWRDQEGNLVGSVGILTDITERKRAEEEKLLREKFQAAVETAGAACHELNQPLQAAIMKLELMLLNLGEDHPLFSQLRSIHQEAQRMSEITHRLNRLTSYRTRQYLKGINILDIDESSS